MNQKAERIILRGFIITALKSLSGVARFLGPFFANRMAQKKHFTIERNRLIPTLDQQSVLLDLYRPRGEAPEGGWPLALLIHGGGFGFFSKDSHALVAAQLVSLGYLTIACEYRLAPEHPFPAGLIDVFSVYDWLHHEAESLRIDLKKIVIVGESAGANFALGVTLVASGLAEGQRSESFLPELKLSKTWAVPVKLVLHCGYLQTSGVDRFFKNNLSKLVQERTRKIQEDYLPESLLHPEIKDWGLADPLCILEKQADQAHPLVKNFPEVFIPVGGADPVLEDSLRLGRVLEKLEHAATRIKIYPGAPHALYAMPWQERYEECWKDLRGFLSEVR